MISSCFCPFNHNKMCTEENKSLTKNPTILKIIIDTLIEP